MIRVAALMALLGIVLNRLNISVIAFKWYEPVRYVPTWMEIEITLAIICAEIWVFRWIVQRMPVVSEPPARPEPQPVVTKPAPPAVEPTAATPPASSVG